MALLVDDGAARPEMAPGAGDVIEAVPVGSLAVDVLTSFMLVSREAVGTDVAEDAAASVPPVLEKPATDVMGAWAPAITGPDPRLDIDEKDVNERGRGAPARESIRGVSTGEIEAGVSGSRWLGGLSLPNP